MVTHVQKQVRCLTSKYMQAIFAVVARTRIYSVPTDASPVISWQAASPVPLPIPRVCLTTGQSGKPLAVSMPLASSVDSLANCGALYFFFRPNSEFRVDLLGSHG